MSMDTTTLDSEEIHLAITEDWIERLRWWTLYPTGDPNEVELNAKINQSTESLYERERKDRRTD